VLIVRHGQSVGNAQRRWQGQLDFPLTDLGRQGAADAAEHLAGLVPPLATIWSSPLRRALDTAVIVADRLGSEVATDERLQERYAGAWQGLTTEEIDARWPGHRAEGRWPDDAEPTHAVAARATAALRHISEAADAADLAGPIVVVSHAGVIRSLQAVAGGPDDPIANLGGTWFELVGGTVRVVSSLPAPPAASPVVSDDAPVIADDDTDRL